MSDTKLREFAEIPQQFAKEGSQVNIPRSLRAEPLQVTDFKLGSTVLVLDEMYQTHTEWYDINITDTRQNRLKPRIFAILYSEYYQLCQAVLIGFCAMGFIGYIVKLVHIPM